MGDAIKQMKVEVFLTEKKVDMSSSPSASGMVSACRKSKRAINCLKKLIKPISNLNPIYGKWKLNFYVNRKQPQLMVIIFEVTIRSPGGV